MARRARDGQAALPDAALGPALARRRGRVDTARALVCLGLTAGVVASYRLYLTHASYPMVPIARGLVPLPPPLDAVLLGVLLVLLVASAVAPRPAWLLIGALAVAAMLAAWDQSRWQPWFYQYLLLLAALVPAPGAGPEDTGRGLATCRAIVACTYLWSGLQKLNATFATLVFPWFVEPLAHALPPSLTAWLPWAGVVSALLEAAIGVALFVPRVRRPAVLAAVATHGLVLVALGPWGHAHNWVVLPWNVVMAALDVVLFWNVTHTAAIAAPRRLDRHAVLVALAGGLPALSFVGLWDAYLSGALYSGNIAEAVVAMTPAVRQRLPPEMARYVITNRQGAAVLVVGDWSLGEVGAPPYPQPRVYRALARDVCAYAGAPDEVRLLIFERPQPWSVGRETTTADCAALPR